MERREAVITLGHNTLLMSSETGARGVQVRLRGPRTVSPDDSNVRAFFEVTACEEGAPEKQVLAATMCESQLRAVATALLHWADVARDNRIQDRRR